MMNRARLLSLVALAGLSFLSIVGATQADARVASRRIRLEAYLEVAPEGTRSEATWSVDVGGKSIILQVTKLRVIAGPGTPSDAIQALKPYRAAAFKIVGDEGDLQRLANAAARSKIDLQGSLRLSPARTLLLDTLEIHEGMPHSAPAKAAPH